MHYYSILLFEQASSILDESGPCGDSTYCPPFSPIQYGFTMPSLLDILIQPSCTLSCKVPRMLATISKVAQQIFGLPTAYLPYLTIEQLCTKYKTRRKGKDVFLKMERNWLAAQVVVDVRPLVEDVPALREGVEAPPEDVEAPPEDVPARDDLGAAWEGEGQHNS